VQAFQFALDIAPDGRCEHTLEVMALGEDGLLPPAARF
jgi:hypothetical protein